MSAQEFRPGPWSGEPYCVQQFYDRVADSSRTVAVLPPSPRRFGLGSRVSLDLSYTYPGRRLTAPPEWVTISLESFTPARGGWAFARPRPLEVRSVKAWTLKVSPAEYRKQPVHLFDSGRRERLSFRVATPAFLMLAAEPELSLKVGPAVMRLRGRRMELLRLMAHRLRPGATDGGRACD
ncbi:MAG: hypothetical protein ACREMX_05785 [Gemmatimonadales bacterium]